MNKEFLQLDQEIKQCTMCPLSKTRTQVVTGRGSSDPLILFIGEAPGKDEDEGGLPFIGESGKILDKWIKYIEIRPIDYGIINLLKCWPPNNRNPKKEEINICSPWLVKQIEIMKPKVYVTIGVFSTVFFLGKNFKSGILKYKGKFYKNEYGEIVMPWVHPSWYLRNGKLEAKDASEQLDTLKLYYKSIRR